MSDSTFTHDVFLSHSAKDKAVVRSLAERLKGDGLRVWFDEWEIRPGDNIPLKIEEGLERSRMLVLCMSANAFGSDWAQLESQTFRFRDPLNRERRLVPLRLDDTPVKGSLAQFRYVDLHQDPDGGYAMLREACGGVIPRGTAAAQLQSGELGEFGVQLQYEVKRLGKQTEFLDMQFSPDRTLSLGAVGNTVHLWEVATGRCLRILDGHAQVVSVTWSPDQVHAAASALDRVLIWDLSTGECVRVLEGHTKQILGMSWSPDGRYVLSASRDCSARVWEAETGRCVHILQGFAEAVYSGVISAADRLALSGSLAGSIRLWDVASERCLKYLGGHSGAVCRLDWSPDHKLVLSASGDKTARLWDLDSGKCVQELTGHAHAVLAVALGSGQRYALSGSFDQTARVWDLKSGRCLRVLRGHTGPVLAVAWGGRRERAYSCDAKGNLNVWDLTGFLADL